MKKGKIILVLLSISIFINTFVSVSSAENNIAFADLGSQDKYTGIANVKMENDAVVNVVERGNSRGWLLSANAKAMYLDFADDFLSNLDDGTEVSVDIEYFDQDDGHFVLLYDGLNSERELSDLVIVENTNRWKTCSFTIDDGYFGGRLDGHDMKISIKEAETDNITSADVVIGKITVHKYPQKNPVRAVITTEEPGNVFGNNDELKIKVAYHNFSNELMRPCVLLEVVKSNGDVLWSKSDNIEIGAKSDVEKEYEMELSEYSVYDFKITITGENFHSQTARTFSFINSDPDGIQNSDFQYNVHYAWEGYSKELPEILLKGNVGGVREHIMWSEYEKPKGVFTLDNMKHNNIKYMESFFQHDDNIIILGRGHTYYGWNSGIPEFEENDIKLKAWYDYCYNVAKDTKGKISKFEVWNEPVLAGFSGRKKNADPELIDDYIKLMETAYTAIKSANPDAKIAGISQAGINNAVHFEWFSEVLKQGGWQYMDAYSFHPYTATASLDNQATMQKSIEKSFAEFEKYGISKENIEFWFTETGYSLTDIDHDEVLMGNNIAKDFIYAKSMGYCDEFTVYDAVQDGIVPSYREHKFGRLNNHLYSLNKVNLSATKAYPIITQMNYMLADAEPDRVVKYNDDVDIYLYKSNKFNKDIGILWSRGNSCQVNLDLGTDAVEVYDNYGAKTIVNGVDGRFTFDAHNVCKYIVGDFERCTPSENQIVEISNIDISAACGDIIYINYKNNTEKNISCEIEKIASNVKVIETVEDETIAFRIPDITNESSTIRLNFKSGDKIVQSTDIILNYKEKIETSIKTSLYDNENLDKWIGSITVENLSGTYNINGYIKFNSPKSFASLGKIPTGPIPKRKSADIEVIFPYIKKKGIMFIDYDVVLNDGNQYNYQCINDFTLAKKAEIPPKIDGIIEKGEWELSTTMYSENPEQVKLIKGYGGVSDLSARTNIAWDEENYYMAVKVTDDVFCQESVRDKIWQGDSVQFGIVIAPEMDIALFGQSSVTFSELGMALTEEGTVVWRWSAEDSVTHQPGEVTNAECAVTRNGNETIYELKIPWSEIIPNKENINHARPLGFSMLVNDNDGTGRRGWMEYASGIGQTKNSTLFTYLKLVE